MKRKNFSKDISQIKPLRSYTNHVNGPFQYQNIFRFCQKKTTVDVIMHYSLAPPDHPKTNTSFSSHAKYFSAPPIYSQNTL